MPQQLDSAPLAQPASQASLRTRNLLSWACWVTILGGPAAMAAGWLLSTSLTQSRAGAIMMNKRIATMDPELALPVAKIVAEEAAKAHIHCPSLVLSNEKVASAASKRLWGRSVIILTEGLLGCVNDRELRAVLQHEMSHDANHDSLRTVAARGVRKSMSYARRYMVLAPLFVIGSIFAAPRAVLAVVGSTAMLATIGVSAASLVVESALNRGREARADRRSAQITRGPLALASALCAVTAQNLKLAGWQSPEDLASDAPGFSRFRLFADHPATAGRIVALEHTSGESLTARVGGSRSVLSQIHPARARNVDTDRLASVLDRVLRGRDVGWSLPDGPSRERRIPSTMRRRPTWQGTDGPRLSASARDTTSLPSRAARETPASILDFQAAPRRDVTVPTRGTLG